MTMKHKKNWESYCETAFNSMKANIHNWGKPDFERSLTRIFYINVFDSGFFNCTKIISENALHNKLSGKKTVHDHYHSPQFVGRMIYDNPDKYLEDFEVFRNIFFECTKTIVVTSEENFKLSALTSNDGKNYAVKVPTHLKYDHLDIKLFKKRENQKSWWYVDQLDTSIIEVPKELTEYEKAFLVE